MARSPSRGSGPGFVLAAVTTQGLLLEQLDAEGTVWRRRLQEVGAYARPSLPLSHGSLFMAFVEEPLLSGEPKGLWFLTSAAFERALSPSVGSPRLVGSRGGHWGLVSEARPPWAAATLRVRSRRGGRYSRSACRWRCCRLAPS
jgi:hypothetical protein